MQAGVVGIWRHAQDFTKQSRVEERRVSVLERPIVRQMIFAKLAQIGNNVPDYCRELCVVNLTVLQDEKRCQGIA